MRDKTCCFTGHRDIGWPEKAGVKRRTKEHIRMLCERGVKYFGVGGALGYDTLAAEALFELRSGALPHIKVILVYPFDGFTDRWSERQRAIYAEMLPHYDKIVRVSESANNGSYLKRDRHLVDCASYCICYCRRDLGGTAYTVRYALKRGLTVFNTADYDVQRLL